MAGAARNTFREDRHTDQCEHPDWYPDEPRGYLAWHEWAEEKMKTHTQRKCPHCGLYAWFRKAGTMASDRAASSDSRVADEEFIGSWEDRSRVFEQTCRELEARLAEAEREHDKTLQAAWDSLGEQVEAREKAEKERDDALTALRDTREAADDAFFALLPLLPLTGAVGQGYKMAEKIDPHLVAEPEEWASAAQAMLDLRAVLGRLTGHGRQA